MRIATRGSELALWQANHVRDLLRATNPSLDTEIIIVSTSGDRDKSTPLHQIGGKGIFVKEVQAVVLRNEADIAVHSAKDMPAISPDGLTLGAVPQRGRPTDVLVGAQLNDLSPGALIGTGSVRRRAQLTRLRPDLTFGELRGNIASRLDKANNFDAIVMAAAALERLGEKPPILHEMGVDDMVPQVGQGALAIECRVDDDATATALSLIEDKTSRRIFDCERSFLRELGGDCSLPAAAHAVLDGDGIALTGFLASEDLMQSQQRDMSGSDGPALGIEMASTLRTLLSRA